MGNKGDKIVNLRFTIKNGVMFAIFLAIISGVLSGLVGLVIQPKEKQKIEERQKELLIIGAASTYHMLENKGCIDNTKHNLTFINCATDDAFSFLKGVSQYQQKKFFSFVIITARQGKINDFFDDIFGRNLMQQFRNQGDRIVECKFEEKDSLMVYIEINNPLPEQEGLSIKDITNIIEEQNKNQPINIYIPHGNATWRTYINLFKSEGKETLIENEKILRFQQSTTEFTSPYIILSSKYFPTNVYRKSYKVKKNDKSTDLEYKELFLYFIIEKGAIVDEVIQKFYKDAFYKKFKIENFKEDPVRGDVVLIERKKE